MIDLILQFHDFLKDKSIKITNKKLHKEIQNLFFLPISEKLEQPNNDDIFQKFNETSAITINKFSEHDQPTDTYFVIGFKQTLLFIQSRNLSFLLQLFESKKDLTIIFLSNSKDSFEKHINIKYQEISSFNFIETISNGISNYIQNCFYFIDDKSRILNEKVWPIIEPCILNTLALECYQKVKIITRFNGSQIDLRESEQSVNKKKITNNDDYFEIAVIAYGSSCTITLAYLIEKVEIFVIKKAYTHESKKLTEREIANYLDLSKYDHPFLPKFIGSIDEVGFGIEYIYGQELSKINSMNLDIKDKFTIIFELLILFAFIHSKKYIYRDLKPNNIIIDHNKTPVLIDLDRMIQIDNLSNEKTNDFESNFVDPKIKESICSFKSDVYSIGKIMLYILDDYIKDGDTDQTLNKICQNCMSDDEESRPQVSELLIEFYTNFSSHINIKNAFKNNKKYFSQIYEDENTIIAMEDFEIEQDELYSETERQIPQKNNNTHQIFNKTGFSNYFENAFSYIIDNTQCALGLMYEEIDIDKAIKHLSKAAEKNNAESLYELGNIFSDKSKGHFDFNKALECYTKAAELNSYEAMHELGMIYLSGIYIKRDINKAIKYLTRSAIDFNYSFSQYKLGIEYQTGSNVTRDMKKSIFYFDCASKQGDIFSQIRIGLIYLTGEDIIQQDIDKAIDYFTLAANQEDENALYNLGLIYTSPEYDRLNISKGIICLVSASKKNNKSAQYLLGELYEIGKIVSKDINKCIWYYKLAAENGHSMAQYKLGEFNRKGIGVVANINKAIYYYELATKSNHVLANYWLGIIFYSGTYIKPDINRAIYYFQRALDLGDFDSSIYLASIYKNNENRYYDMKKAFYYLELAAEHGNDIAEFFLGDLYLKEKQYDKAIKYLNKASDKNNENAQLYLALIYLHGISVESEKGRTNIDPKEDIYDTDLKGSIDEINLKEEIDKINLKEEIDKINMKEKIDKINIKEEINKINIKEEIDKINMKEEIDKINMKEKIDQKKFNDLYNNIHEKKRSKQNCSNYKVIIPADFKKAVEYFQKSSKKGEKISLYFMGVLHMVGKVVPKSITYGIYLLSISADKNCKSAQFMLGFLYHEGKYVQHDIEKAIYYYKKGSSNNDAFAKNNLGIINKDQQKFNDAIIYFIEARKLGSNLACYNLAHTFFFDLNLIDHAIAVLIQYCSIYPRSDYCEFLCLIIVKKLDFNIEIFQKEIHECKYMSNKLKNELLFYLTSNKLYDKNIYNEKLKFYRYTKYAYNFLKLSIHSSCLYNKTPQKCTPDLQHLNITSEFYEGFGINI